jgi:hypothetical protein
MIHFGVSKMISEIERFHKSSLSSRTIRKNLSVNFPGFSFTVATLKSKIGTPQYVEVSWIDGPTKDEVILSGSVFYNTALTREFSQKTLSNYSLFKGYLQRVYDLTYVSFYARNKT